MNHMEDPIEALSGATQEGVLAVITGVEGPSYRPVGAVMALFGEKRRVGTLSSGCIESDLGLHAETALASGRPVRLRYGRGSPFIDIQLPCGGGLDILLVPRPDKAVLAGLSRKQKNRSACTLVIDPNSGGLTLRDQGETGFAGSLFQVRFLPEIFFYVFGKGPEASTFTALVQSAGYPGLLLSPDAETLATGRQTGATTRHLKTAKLPKDIQPDPWSAVLLFFHDHEWEPPILKQALDSRAFYIGAQGSQRARDNRLAEVRSLGVSEAQLARLKGPIGLVPSARDARTLAVSVLAEVLSVRAGMI